MNTGNILSGDDPKKKRKYKRNAKNHVQIDTQFEKDQKAFKAALLDAKKADDERRRNGGLNPKGGKHEPTSGTESLIEDLENAAGG